MTRFEHRERCGKGREVVHELTGPWLLDTVENFPKLGFSQRVQIGDFAAFGKGLVIDGMAQLSESIDEVYTGALVDPAALSAKSRKRWLFVGAGDGAGPRRALEYADTERVLVVDISETVVRETQKFIPSFLGDAAEDPRLEIRIGDGFAFIQDTDERFDIVVCDMVDPADETYTPFFESSGDHIYTSDSMALFERCLSPDGIFVMQAQELSLLRWEGHKQLRDMLKKVYSSVYSYRVFVEFFGYWESFLIASPDPRWQPLTPIGFREMLGVYGVIMENLGYETTDEARSYSRYLASLFALHPSLIEKLGR